MPDVSRIFMWLVLGIVAIDLGIIVMLPGVINDPSEVSAKIH